jgi:hypothetical protein
VERGEVLQRGVERGEVLLLLPGEGRGMRARRLSCRRLSRRERVILAPSRGLSGNPVILWFLCKAESRRVSTGIR